MREFSFTVAQILAFLEKGGGLREEAPNLVRNHWRPRTGLYLSLSADSSLGMMRS